MLGSALLAAVVIGSGIAAQQLSPGQTGLELFENAAATAAGLFALILMFGAVSGAHFNPVVSFVDAAFGGIGGGGPDLPARPGGRVYRRGHPGQRHVLDGGDDLHQAPGHGRHFLSEIVATAGLMVIIFALARSGRMPRGPAAVGAYIGAAYSFTSSTSFANPAITVGACSPTRSPVSPPHLCRPSSPPRSSAA